MDDFDLFLHLPIAGQAAVVCLAAYATCLFVMLLTAPRWNCFFFRWSPGTRFLALLASPVLLVLSPILLYAWFMQCLGIDLGDLDFDDD